MSQYVSKFSGVDIDRAVAYYNDMQRIGRVILTVPVSDSSQDWLESSTDYDRDKANYYADITTYGVHTISSSALAEPPQVYFLDSNGLRWESEYRYYSEERQGQNVNHIRCYSNARKNGKFVIVSVLSNGIIGGDSSFDSDLTVRNLTVIGTITQPDVVSSSNN